MMIYTLLVLLLIKELTSSALHSACEYDQTKILNETIVQIFQKHDYSANLESILPKVKSEIYFSKYEAENTQKLKPFGSKILLKMGYTAIKGPPERVHTDFHKNETNIYFKRIDYTLHGTAYINPNETSVEFYVYTSCINYTIVLKHLSKNQDDENKFHIDISCDAYTTGTLATRLGNHDRIPYNDQLNLIYALNLVSPKVLDHPFHNKKALINFLEENFSIQPMRLAGNVSARDANRTKNEQPGYYSIPTVSLMYLNLTNIKIIGLWNLQSYEPNTTISNHANTLTLSDIRGSMDASHEALQIPPVGMNFTIDHLYISVDQKENKIWVEARNYSISQANCHSSVSISSWINKYSEIIMGLIESALGHSLMPSMRQVAAVDRRSSTASLREMEKCFSQLLKNVTIK